MRKLISMKLITSTLLVLVGSLSAKLSAQNQFIGQIMFVPYNFAPQGWHDCDGSLLQISQNTALFSLLGTTYGGNGMTNFALPNAQGRVIIDDGQGAGLSDYYIGQTGGTESVTLSIAEMPTHTHQLMGTAEVANQNKPNAAYPAKTKTLDKEYSTSTLAADEVIMKSTAVSAVGGNQAHENRMPSLALKCIIAMQGVFPARP